MRHLMLFTIGFCGAAALCAYLLWNTPAVWLILGVVSLLLAIVFFFVGRHWSRVVAVCLLGFAVGNFWYWGYDALYLGIARQMDGKSIQASITVTDYSFANAYGEAVDGEITLEGKRYQIRVYLNDSVSLKPGDRLSGSFRLRYTSSGSRRGESFHRGEGMFLLASAQGELSITPGDSRAFQYLPQRIRYEVLGRIPRLFPQDTAAFASALLIGDDDELTYEDSTALKLSGIRHVVAVSGQHLVILMAAVLLLTGKSRRIACYLSIPVMLLFCAVCGFTPSILRACIMQLVMVLGFLSRQEYDGPTALAFSLLCMVAVNPLAVTSVSLQLSAASVMGMLMFSKPLYERVRGWFFLEKYVKKGLWGNILHWLVGTFSVTIASMVFTLPLSAVYFGTVSLVGILTNLATLWIISLTFYGILAAVAIGLLWASPGAVLGWLLAWPIRFVLVTARALSQIPLGCIYLQNWVLVIACGLCYILLLWWLCSRRLRLCYAGCMMVAVLTVGLMISCVSPLKDAYRITVLDVGQGQCVILQSGQRVYMVDCGGDYDTSTADLAAETLLSMGISRLDGLILTHFDDDHAASAQYLLTRVCVDRLILPEDPEHPYMSLLKSACPQGATVAREDLCFAWDGGKITIFAGNGGDYGNEMSLCVLFQSGNCDILITGDRPVDREVALIHHAALPKLEYLVAGHHGASTSTGTALLAATRPDTVLISVGENNRYGHPSPDMLQRLKLFGCALRRTDLEGTIMIRG